MKKQIKNSETKLDEKIWQKFDNDGAIENNQAIASTILAVVDIEEYTESQYIEICKKIDFVELERAKDYVDFCCSIVDDGTVPPRKKGRDIIIDTVHLYNQLYKSNGYALDKEIAKTITAYIILGQHGDLFLDWRVRELESHIITSTEIEGRLLSKLDQKDLSEILLLANQLNIVNSLEMGMDFLAAIIDRNERIKLFHNYYESINGHLRRANVFLDITDQQKELAYKQKIKASRNNNCDQQPQQHPHHPLQQLVG